MSLDASSNFQNENLADSARSTQPQDSLNISLQSISLDNDNTNNVNSQTNETPQGQDTLSQSSIISNLDGDSDYEYYSDDENPEDPPDNTDDNLQDNSHFVDANNSSQSQNSLNLSSQVPNQGSGDDSVENPQANSFSADVNDSMHASSVITNLDSNSSSSSDENSEDIPPHANTGSNPEDKSLSEDANNSSQIQNLLGIKTEIAIIGSNDDYYSDDNSEEIPPPNNSEDNTPNNSEDNTPKNSEDIPPHANTGSNPEDKSLSDNVSNSSQSHDTLGQSSATTNLDSNNNPEDVHSSSNPKDDPQNQSLSANDNDPSQSSDPLSKSSRIDPLVSDSDFYSDNTPDDISSYSNPQNPSPNDSQESNPSKDPIYRFTQISNDIPRPIDSKNNSVQPSQNHTPIILSKPSEIIDNTNDFDSLPPELQAIFNEIFTDQAIDNATFDDLPPQAYSRIDDFVLTEDITLTIEDLLLPPKITNSIIAEVEAEVKEDRKKQLESEARKKQDEYKKSLNTIDGIIKQLNDQQKHYNVLLKSISSHKEEIEKLNNEIQSLTKEMNENDSKLQQEQSLNDSIRIITESLNKRINKNNEKLAQYKVSLKNVVDSISKLMEAFYANSKAVRIDPPNLDSKSDFIVNLNGYIESINNQLTEILTKGDMSKPT